jgi:hypothetical protein
MMEYADRIYNQGYDVRTNNCGDLVNQSLGAGNVPGAGKSSA